MNGEEVDDHEPLVLEEESEEQEKDDEESNEQENFICYKIMDKYRF